MPLVDLLDAQHYRLADWHLAATELNWRRFFDISSLIAVRVEDPAVFEATHEVILRLVTEGLIDGLAGGPPRRARRPPRLPAAARGPHRRPVGVHREDPLRAARSCPRTGRAREPRATTRWAWSAACSWIPPGPEPLTAAYQQPDRRAWRVRAGGRGAKREEASQALAAEVSRLARLAGEAGHPDLDVLSVSDRTAVLVELLTAMPVYRAYVVPGEPAPPESAVTRGPGRRGRPARLPERLHPALGAVVNLVLGRGAGGGALQARLIVAFQQVCGPVMAKGVEDTAFYRWSRLVALNEVGGDPDSFGTSPAEFHEFACAAVPGLAGQHDHAVHARHQAPGGRAGPARGAGRDPGGLGR